MEIANLFYRVAAEGFSDVSSKLNNLSDKITSIGQKFKLFGSALTAGITTPLLGLAKAGIEYDMTLQNLQSSFKVLLGSEEKAANMTQKLKSIASSTPFELPGLAEAAQTLLAFGVQEENVIPLTKRLGDVALGNEEKFKGLSFVMGQINALGRLQAGDLNQLINRGWNPLNEITARTGETMTEVRKRMSKGKITYKEVAQALEDATSKGGRFYKGMEEGSKTLSGKLSTLRDNFNELLGNAMKPFFDFLSEIAIPKLIELVNKFLNLDPTLQTTATTVAIVAAAIGPLAVVLGTLITIAGGAVAGLTTLIAAFSSIGVIVPVVGGAIAGIVTIFGALILSSEDVRIAIKQKFGAIVNKIKEAANLIKKHFGEIKKAFFELIKGIRTGEFGDFINTMKDLVPPEAMEKIHKLIMKLSQLRDIVIEVRNYTIKNFDDIRGAFENLIKGIATGNFGDFVNNMKNLVPPETMEKIHNLIINFVEFRDKVIDIKNTIVDFGKGVIYALSGVGQIFANTFNNINWEPTITAFNNLKKSLETVKPALAAIGLVVSTVLVVAINMLISVLGSLATIVISAFNVIVSVISFAVNFITALFTDNWGLVYDSTLNLVTALSNLFDGMVSFVINLLKGFVLGIVDFFKFLYETLVGSSIIPDLVNAIIEWFSKLPSKIASIISNLVSQAIAKFNNFKSQVVTIVTNLISKAVEIFNTIKNKIGSIIDSLKSLGQSKFNSIKSVILSIIDSLKNMMQNKFNEAKSKVLSILESLKSGISSKMNSIKSFVQPAINAFNSLRTAISNVISRLASLRFPSPPSWLNKILGHATGIINSPFGHLAVVGEQGPELMYVPKGSDIYTAGQTRQMLSNLRNSSNDGKQIATSPSQVKNNENNVFNVSLNVKASEIKDINDLIELFKGIKAEVII